MKTNDKALSLIAKYEGFRSEPYKCPAGVWTIGYGTTRDIEGEKITCKSSPITEEYAMWLLHEEVKKVESTLRKQINVYVNSNQLAALASFVYNLGSGNFHKSTLRKKINAQDFEGAAKEFPRWVYAKGKKLKGLVKRRHEEMVLFMST